MLAWPAALPTGFNHPQLVRYAASPDPTRQRYLTELLDRAEELGLRVFRTWAHFEGGQRVGVLQVGRRAPMAACMLHACFCHPMIKQRLLGSEGP